MRRMLFSVLGMAGLLAALAPPVRAQECSQACGQDEVWRTDGKRYWRTTEECTAPFVMSDRMTIQVAPGDRKEGDVQGFQYVGKRTERVYFREVPRPEPVLVQGHACRWRMHYVGKTTTRERYCVENGVEQPFARHTQFGEHTARK